MTNFIDIIAQKLAELSRRTWVGYTLLALLIVCVTSIICIPIAKQRHILDKYMVIEHSAIDEYNAYRLCLIDKIQIDPIYIPTSDVSGIAVKFDYIVKDEYLEMHLVEDCIYQLSFYKRNRFVASMPVYCQETGVILTKVSDTVSDYGYDCIVIEGLYGERFGLEYINPIAARNDNVVFKELEDIYTPNSFLGYDLSINDPYRVTGIQSFNNGYIDGVLSIEVFNIHDRDIQLVNIVDEDGNLICEFDENTTIPANKLLEDKEPGVELNISANNPRVDYTVYAFDNVNSEDVAAANELYINYYIEENDQISKVLINPFPRYNEELFESTEIREQDNIADFDGLEVKDNKVVLLDEYIAIDKPLFIPREFTFCLEAGQSIDLVNEAFILCRGGVDFDGSDSYGVEFITSDNTGRGLVVMQSENESRMIYTSFFGMNTPVSGVWQLTGAVTFYESDVVIKNCQFVSNTCEDALNIVRSDFLVDSCLFHSTYGDAFDADFCTGEFINSRFENTGNDGFDVSTSVITLADTDFVDIGDKAISGGEKSTLDIQNIYVDNAVIGVASKDASMLEISNITIDSAQVAITLYQKKPEYAGGAMSINNIQLMGDIDIDYLIQQGSKLYIDNEYVEPRSYAKESILFERMINGLSISDLSDTGEE